MFPDLKTELASPTPLASLVSSLVTLAVLAAIYLAFQWMRGQGGKKGAALEYLVARMRAFDKAIVRYGSWVVGTRYARPWVRRVWVPTFFLIIALGGALLPWPWGLFVISLGLLGIFVVYRHWSRDEDEVEREVRPEDKEIKIDGTLTFELVVACAFVLVFAPVAFASMQAAGYGFEVKPEARPFAFVTFTLIELLKAGSMVDYYDLFAEKLQLEKVGNISKPSPMAKWAILTFRFTVSLLILAALKRLLDIARRVSEGLDLRPIEEMLHSGDEAQHEEAIEQLEGFALQGRPGAPRLLEKILVPEKPQDPHFGPDVRFEAASALYEYARPPRRNRRILFGSRGVPEDSP